MKNSNSEKLVSFIDIDSALDLETDNFAKKALNVVFVPVLNNLPKGFKNHIKKTNKAAAEVIDNVTNHDALEVLYSKGKSSVPKSTVQKFFRYVWFHLGNSKAVRNRLKLVRREMQKHLQQIAHVDRHIDVISIASGSSRALIETVRDGHYLKGTHISLTFLDKNPKAIEYSKKLSEDLQRTDLHLSLQWINDTVGNYLRSNPTQKFDIVEIVGLLDYFTDEKIVETFKGIYAILQDGGIVIASNIVHNKEEKFITNVIDWPMVYRSAEELGSLVAQAGFDSKEMKVFYEPLKIHGMVVAKK